MLCHVHDQQKFREETDNPPKKLNVFFNGNRLGKTEQEKEDKLIEEAKARKQKQVDAHKAWHEGYGSMRSHYCANRVPWRLDSEGKGHVNLYNERGEKVSCITSRLNKNLAL